MASEPIYVRSDIIEKVKKGIWNPNRAEAVAARCGVGRLATKPDPSVYDPWRIEWWPLAMVMAWIIWRDEDWVRAAWPQYRAECLEWTDTTRRDKDGKPIGCLTSDLVSGSAATLFTIAAGALEGETGILAAWESLRTRLANGDIAAVGFKDSAPGGTPQDINPSEWLGVDLRLDPRNDAAATPPFLNLLIKSERLREIWPQDEDASMSNAGTPAIPEKPARQSPKQALVEPFLKTLYPAGIPERSTVSDAELVKAVGDAMGTKFSSRETVLRAAGRKK